MEFIRVKSWEFHVFFKGDKSFNTALELSELQARTYLNLKYGSGNWQSASLRQSTVKIKAKKANLIDAEIQKVMGSLFTELSDSKNIGKGII